MRNFLLLSIFSFLFIVSCQKETFNENNSLEESTEMSKKSLSVDTYMVISKSESLSKKFIASIKKHGEITSTIPEIGIAVVQSSDANFTKKIMKLSGTRSVIPDLTVNWLEPIDVEPFSNPISIGNDEPFFEFLWGMDAIDAPEAWNAGYQGDGAKVFILDSGIDAEHPDIAPNLNTELCASFVEGEDWNVRPGFFFNHGTHVAGTVAAAHNKSGVIGVAPMAEIVAVKVLSEYTGSGSFSGINAGIVYAANNGADVINMSLGATLNKNGKFYDEDGNYTGKIPAKYIQEIVHAQQRAVDYAFRNGVTVISSAGNDAINGDGNGSTIILPAELNNVISVSATGPYAIYYNPDSFLDYPSSYTNFGRSLVDVAAPGGDFRIYDYDYWWHDMILSTISGGWSWSAGTSMASPHVAGVAALVIGKNGGEMDPHEVEKQLYNSADKIDTNGKSAYYGKGRVNAFRAVSE